MKLAPGDSGYHRMAWADELLACVSEADLTVKVPPDFPAHSARLYATLGVEAQAESLERRRVRRTPPDPEQLTETAAARQSEKRSVSDRWYIRWSTFCCFFFPYRLSEWPMTDAEPRWQWPGILRRPIR